jgi:hypothetical protein
MVTEKINTSADTNAISHLQVTFPVEPFCSKGGAYQSALISVPARTCTWYPAEKKENIPMKNPQFPFMGGSFDHNERFLQSTEASVSPSHPSAEQHALDTLMNTGFYWEEAIKLLHMREHLYENEEMRQRVSDDLRMHFVRWLYEQGEIHET